jgi:hypothetical protein
MTQSSICWFQQLGGLDTAKKDDEDLGGTEKEKDYGVGDHG